MPDIMPLVLLGGAAYLLLKSQTGTTAAKTGTTAVINPDPNGYRATGGGTQASPKPGDTWLNKDGTVGQIFSPCPQSSIGCWGPAGTSTAPSAPAPPPPVGPTAASVLTKMQAAAAGAGLQQATTWQWNYLLAQVSGINLATQAQDFGKVFPGVDPTVPVSLDSFWAGAASWLKSQGSLSGIGSFPNLLAGNRVRTPRRVIGGWR